MIDIKKILISKKKNTVAIDYVPDPFEGAVALSQDGADGLLRSSDGNLYSPLKDGYQRQRTTVLTPYGEPAKVTTTDDTAKEIVPAVYPTDGDIAGFKILMVYQNSGGALTFSVLDSTGATTLYTKSINNTTYTLLDISDMLLGPPNAGNGTVNGLTVKWSAAAGASQQVLVQWFYNKIIDPNA